MQSQVSSRPPSTNSFAFWLFPPIFDPPPPPPPDAKRQGVPARRGASVVSPLLSPIKISVTLLQAVNMTNFESDHSDGYHTFSELYEHRFALFLALMKALPQLSWVSLKHATGEKCYDGEWFIAGITLPTGNISYHLPIRLYDVGVSTGAKELEAGMEWDGHTSNDVINRLLQFARG